MARSAQPAVAVPAVGTPYGTEMGTTHGSAGDLYYDPFDFEVDANAQAIFDFVAANDWIANLAVKDETRSNTSVCLKIVDRDVLALDADGQAAFAKGVVALLEKEGVAFDIGHYRDAPSGLRIWAGATIETADMKALMPWLTWAFETQKATLAQAAA